MTEKQWAVLQRVKHGDHYDIQVVPLWQWEDHSGINHGYLCVCQPKIETRTNGNVLIIHNEIKTC